MLIIGCGYHPRLEMLAILEKATGELKVLRLEHESGEAKRFYASLPKGVGPIVGLAFVLTLGTVSRFRRSRQRVSYLGLNPHEDSSSSHQHLGHISKQGNSMMQWLLVEAGQTAARLDPEPSRGYKHLKFRRGANVAKVAIAGAWPSCTRQGVWK